MQLAAIVFFVTAVLIYAALQNPRSHRAAAGFCSLVFVLCLVAVMIKNFPPREDQAADIMTQIGMLIGGLIFGAFGGAALYLLAPPWVRRR
jgi:hypothetical protein